MATSDFDPQVLRPNIPTNRKLYITQMTYKDTSLYWYDLLSNTIELYNMTTNNVTVLVGGVANSSYVTGKSFVTTAHVVY